MSNASDGVTFLVYLHAKAETRQRFEELLLDVLKRVACEQHFVQSFVHRSQDDPNLIVLHETWSCSRDYFMEHYLKTDYKKEYEAALPGMLSRPLEILFLNTVTTFPRS
jgi:quinol monooxygenase YgiN